MGNDRLSGKQVGSQASRRVTRRLAWIQPVCISVNAVPALKGLTVAQERENHSATMLLTRCHARLSPWHSSYKYNSFNPV